MSLDQRNSPPKTELDSTNELLGDHYRIEKELGRGGMATVYLARDERVGREVAIKILHPDLAAAVGGDRFKREIDIAGKLTHPHILPIYDSGESDGKLYYVMPFVKGESLRDRINRESQLPVHDAVKLVSEVAMALDYAHAQGVMHRDIKPENILLEGDHAVIADFGIARAIGTATDGPALTQTGVSVGTPTYMSPEQALADKKVDGRSDQYSLACVLYELLAGTPPFSGASMQALIMRHTMEQAPGIRIVRQTVSEDLEAVIHRAMEKSPADRFPTCKAFAEALLAPAGFTSSWRLSTSRGITRVPAPRKIPRLLIVGGAIALVGAVAAGAVWRSKNSEAKRLARIVAMGFEPRRVAIQYFRDVSSSKKFGAVASGLTEGLIDQLSQVSGLDVVSKSGVSRYRDSVEIPRDRFARAFKAPWVVVGDVDEDASNARVTVKLIDGVTGAGMETATFTQPTGKAIALRETLVQQVSDLLRKRIGVEMTSSATRLQANNDEAWLLVQQADKLRRDGEDAAADRNASAPLTFAKADSLLAAAQKLDPKWPEPSIQRSFVTYRAGRTATVPADKLRHYQEAIGIADGVIRADPENPQIASAYEYRGAATFFMAFDHLIQNQRDADSAFARATRDLEKATKLAPKNASAWNTLSFIYAQVPDFFLSKNAALNAYNADPFALRAADILDRLYRTSYITETFNDGDSRCAEGRARFPTDYRFVECELWSNTVADVRPHPSVDTVWMLTDSVQKLAPVNRREFLRREGNVIAGIALGRTGQADSAKRVLDRVMDTPKEIDPGDDLLYYNAFARLTLGDKKTAIDLLKRYLTRHPEHRAGWGKDSAWWWRELKKDPDFQRFIATGG